MMKTAATDGKRYVYLAAAISALGGADALVFAGGIGENAPLVRARICDGLGFLGIEIDEKRNAEAEGVISTDGSRVAVRVIRTDEDLMIARAVSRILETDATLVPPVDHLTSSDHPRSSISVLAGARPS
jgi:acetate kinase